MASSWGLSWGDSWDDSWGAAATTGPVTLEPHGGYPSSYIPVKRKKRKESHEEREEIRAILRKAMEDVFNPQAAAVVEIAEPYVEPKKSGQVQIDWEGMRAVAAELRAAIIEYEAAASAAAKAAADAADEDDTEFLLLH